MTDKTPKWKFTEVPQLQQSGNTLQYATVTKEIYGAEKRFRVALWRGWALCDPRTRLPRMYQMIWIWSNHNGQCYRTSACALRTLEMEDMACETFELLKTVQDVELILSFPRLLHR